LAPHDSADHDASAEADQGLVSAIAGGSSDALGRLYDRHAGRVFALARRIVARPEDAEEIVQDVFAQVWRQAARYTGDRASVAGWIVMLTRTRAIDRLRARRARPDEDQGIEPTPALPLPSLAPDPESITLSQESARQIRGAFETLPDPQRSVLELAYYQGLSHSEIATTTGVPLGTVKTRIRAAMETLRQKMDVTG
jgi:RNA polymerase sigma-70 factor (ECF subfamily)